VIALSGSKLFYFRKLPYGLWCPHILLFNGYRDFFPGVEWPRPEVNHSFPSSAEVKNEQGVGGLYLYLPIPYAFMGSLGAPSHSVYY
jgi:hypothetical protein